MGVAAPGVDAVVVAVVAAVLFVGVEVVAEAKEGELEDEP